MLDKAKAIAEKFASLTEQLSDPEIFGDNAAVTRIGKERARLEPVARLYREVSDLENKLAEARATLNDPELGELGELAALEIEELTPRLDAKKAQLTAAL